MTSFEIESPVKLVLFYYKDTAANKRKNRVGKSKNYSLNMNVYRNAHRKYLTDSKKLYKDIMYQLLSKKGYNMLRFEQIEIEYQITACDNRKFDMMNVISIIDKYFQDVMVELNIIKDDNYLYVKKVTVLPVIKDKKLPENICKITVKEWHE